MNDRFARLLTIGVVVALMLVTAFHRARARRVASARSSAEAPAVPLRAEGRVAWLRLVGLVIWATLIAYFVDPDWMAWSRLALPRLGRWLGAAITILSVPILLWVLRHLGPNLSSGIAPRPSHQLVTTGPYRWIRHPWYSSLLLFLIGLSLLWSSWLLALLTAVRATYFLVRSRVEDDNLAAFFGDAYRAYARAVPGFLPRLGGRARAPGARE